MADGTDIVVSGKRSTRPENELTLNVGGNALSGWEEIELTLRAEGFPNSFRVALSSKQPVTSAATVARAGDACTVLLGDDVVLTGYVDRDANRIDGARHELEIVGRGKTQDLVDCSAEWPSHQMVQGNVLDIATRLALPYSIGVELADGAPVGGPIPPVLLNYGETAANIIQRVARNAGLLAYENAQGKLVLAIAGASQAASGIVYGSNVQACTCENAMDERYSDYVCCSLGVDAFIELPGDNFFATISDPNVPRHRSLDLVLEGVATDPYDFTRKKAIWEQTRRAGRGTVVRATVDSWRDAAGTLWAPNTMVPVQVPGFRLTDTALCISEVTFRRSNETGTTADLVLLPRFAFTPEPISLLPLAAADALGPDQ